jgi:heme exporter protein C
LGIATALTMAVALYLALVWAPEDSVQGPAQRIFYIHVPMAWIAYLAFFVVFVASGLYLWRRAPFWDQIARSSAEIGLVFTTLVLLTGSLWGRPIWGTWWTWDARLTTTLLLWFIYLGYFMLRSYAGEQGRAARFSAVLGIIGFIDVPIIHMSVTWWRTLHPQPIAARIDGPNMPGEMVVALLVSLAAFTLLYAALMLQKYTIERAKDQLVEHQFRLAEQQFEGIPT